MLGWWSHLLFKESHVDSSPWRASWNSVHFSGLESSRKGLSLFCLFCFRKTDVMVSLLHQNAVCFSYLGRLLTWPVLCHRGRKGALSPKSPRQPRPVCRPGPGLCLSSWAAGLPDSFLSARQSWPPGSSPQTSCHKVNSWKSQATEQDLLRQKFTSSGPEAAMVNRRGTGERQEAERAEFNFSDIRERVSPPTQSNT